MIVHIFSEGTMGSRQQMKTEGVLLSDDKMREYLVLFRFFDYDKNGQLPHHEFKRSLWALGRLPFYDEQPKFERILNVVDPNRDGFVTRRAFMAYLVNEHMGQGTFETYQQLYEQRIEQLLRHMELHGDGVQHLVMPNCFSTTTSETTTAPMTNDGTHKSP
ncbi:hypothetical protein niasHS_008994 [Heterodera schachtii]|uniref:EF-hand domain-containing protein n=2 Tax=Heterodera TaxID=34509 RepID=A0ABD2J4K3_HETSC